MECLDCGAENEAPAAESILTDAIFEENNIDVDLSAQQHLQLTCSECGAVLGYTAVGAATGSSNVRGFY